MHCHETLSSRCSRRPGVLGHSAGLAIGAALVLLLGTAVMLLWNAVLPALLHTAHITFWQSIGLLLLARILVGGFHPHHRFRSPRREARLNYEAWWREVGEQSFQRYGARQPANEDRN